MRARGEMGRRGDERQGGYRDRDREPAAAAIGRPARELATVANGSRSGGHACSQARDPRNSIGNRKARSRPHRNGQSAPSGNPKPARDQQAQRRSRTRPEWKPRGKTGGVGFSRLGERKSLASASIGSRKATRAARERRTEIARGQAKMDSRRRNTRSPKESRRLATASGVLVASTGIRVRSTRTPRRRSGRVSRKPSARGGSQKRRRNAMISHVVLFRPKPTLTAAERASLVAGTSVAPSMAFPRFGAQASAAHQAGSRLDMKPK